MNNTNVIENHMLKSAVRKASGAKRDAVSEEEAWRCAFAQTERKLYDLNVTRAKLEDLREYLTELDTYGIKALRSHSRSLVRTIRPGMRITDEEELEYERASVVARIAEKEIKLQDIDTALALIKDDEYFPMLDLRYNKNLGDGEIAEKLRCDRSTVSRNRKRLVSKVAEWLY